MDHLPRPLGSSTPDINVPLLDIVPFEQPWDFFIFAERHGIESAIDENISSTQLATIIQSWLFFGLLADHLGYMPNLSDLSRIQMVDGHLISCVSLQLLANMPYDEQDGDDNDKSDDDIDPRVLRFVKKAKLANTWLNDLEKLPCAATSPVPVIVLSTRILIESLIALRIPASLKKKKKDERVFDPFGRGMKKFQMPSTTIQDPPPSLRLVIDRLYLNGWCPEQAKGLVQSLGYMPLYYMSQIKRHNPQGLDHQKCQDAICTAGVSSDRIPGVPRHRWPRCACDLHPVPIKDILDTLRQGKIPLIRLMEGPSGEVIISVEPLTTRSRYVALSHVWSDGLGNKAGNSVYKCQLEQIRRQLANMPVHDESGAVAFSSKGSIDLRRLRISLGLPKYAVTLFWLDILCIPVKGLTDVNDIELSQLRERAISQIPVVFAGAAQTLVIDSELQNLRLSGSQLPEIAARLLGSQWGSRAWTFQEAAQAVKCRVQLADGAFNPVDDHLWRRTWAGFRFRPRVRPQRGATDDGLPLFPSMSPYFKVRSIRTFLEKHLLIAFQNHLLPWFLPKDTPWLYKDNSSDEQALVFTRTWNELLLRSTSQASDLDLILAMSLNLPLYRILALPVSQRLRYILWSLDRIPLGLLFIPRPLAQNSMNTPDMLNSWAPENIHGSSLRAFYPLAARDFGEFSDEKDCLTFHLRTDDHLVIIPLTGKVLNTPRLRLQTARGKHQIRFHRPSTPVAGSSYPLGKLLVIDPRSVAPEGRQCKDPWKTGCSFDLQEARAIGKFEWELSLIYDGAISTLEETSEDGNLCDHCRGSSDSVFQQYSNDSEDQESWASLRVTTLHLSLPCVPPDTSISPLVRRYLSSSVSSGCGLVTPIMFIAGLGYMTSMVAFIIHNVRAGYSNLSMLGKISFYLWWLPYAMVFISLVIIAAQALIGSGYLLASSQRYEDLIIQALESEAVIWVMGLGSSAGVMMILSAPLVAWVLFVCDFDNRPYRVVDLLFIISGGLYFLSNISTAGVAFGWTYLSRRLWIASHGTNPSLAFSSPWEVASWKSAFSQGDWPANVVLLLRIDKLLRFLTLITMYVFQEDCRHV